MHANYFQCHAERLLKQLPISEKLSAELANGRLAMCLGLRQIPKSETAEHPLPDFE